MYQIDLIFRRCKCVAFSHVVLYVLRVILQNTAGNGYRPNISSKTHDSSHIVFWTGIWNKKKSTKNLCFFHEKTLLTFTFKWTPTNPPKLFYTISDYLVTSWMECGFLFRDVLRKYKNNHPGGSVSQSDFSNMTHQGGSFLKVYLPPLHFTSLSKVSPHASSMSHTIHGTGVYFPTLT